MAVNHLHFWYHWWKRHSPFGNHFVWNLAAHSTLASLLASSGSSNKHSLGFMPSASFISNDFNMLTYPLRHWTFSPNLWNGYWSANDECISEHDGNQWKVWIPQSHCHSYGQCFHLSKTPHCSQLISPQVALIEKHANHIVFLGAGNVIKPIKNRKEDFWNSIQDQPKADWAFQDLY